MQKDYWNIAKRDFRAMGLIVVLVLLVSIFALSNLENSGASSTRLIISIVTLLVFGFVYFFTAHLFKKRSPKAIPVAYSILGVIFVTGTINNVVAGTLISGSMIVGTLIQIYLFYIVYKASKQKVL